MKQKSVRLTDNEIQRLFDVRRSGKPDLQKITPVQAAALLEARQLTAKVIHELAHIWLESGEDQNSAELASLALNRPASLREAKASFHAALREMAVVAPAGDQMVLTVLEIYLDAIVSGQIGTMAGMAALDELLLASYDTSLKTPRDPLVRHPKSSNMHGQTHLGHELGLEYMYTWYRELQDAEDRDDSTWYYNELPLDKQLDKFDEELIREAQELYYHLASKYSDLFCSGVAITR